MIKPYDRQNVAVITAAVLVATVALVVLLVYVSQNDARMLDTRLAACELIEDKGERDACAWTVAR